MLRQLCCLTRKTTEVELDGITDSLEYCLSDRRGVSEFQSFLTTNGFDEQLRTLEFFLRCESTLVRIGRLSPGERRELPSDVQTAINTLRDMNINFTRAQTEAFSEGLQSNTINGKVEAIQSAQGWAKDLLQDTYIIFRRDFLRRYETRRGLAAERNPQQC